MEPCPVCREPLADCSQIGPYCENEDCPVEDDALLWYEDINGQWQSQHWVTYQKDGKTYLRLSEKVNAKSE